MANTYNEWYNINREKMESWSGVGVIAAGLAKEAGRVSVGPGGTLPDWSKNAAGAVILVNNLFYKGYMQYTNDTNEDREYAFCKAMFNVSLGIGGAIAIGYAVEEAGLVAAPGIAAAVIANWAMGRTTADLYDDLQNLPEAWEGYQQATRDSAVYLVVQAIVAESAIEKTIKSSLESLATAFSETAVSAEELYNDAIAIAQNISDYVNEHLGTAQWDMQRELLQTMRDLLGPLFGVPTLPDAHQFRQLLERAGDIARGLVGDLGQWNEFLHFLVNGNWPGESYPDACLLTAPETPPQAVRTDPLVLDLDGDGIQTTREGRSWSEGRAFFDHNGDGFAERTGWVSANDGLLVMDRNGDGIINNGRELFGSGATLAAGGTATTGFQALADLDSNHDGIINANDALFSQLQVWKDEDEDPECVASEPCGFHGGDTHV